MSQDEGALYGPTGQTRIILKSLESNAWSPVGQLQHFVYDRDILGNITGYGWRPMASPAPAAPAPAAVAPSTGVNPVETTYSLYGHIIPLSVFGLGRIGGEIIAGPWVSNGNATFCISFGVPADPYGSRSPLEIAFDSEVVWTSAGGFNTEPFTFRWYPGTLTQAADSIEIAHYGSSAVAYRPQMLLWFENLPLGWTKFKKIPYVACLFEDSSGHDVNLGEAFRRLAYSPWVGYTSAQFDTTGITDGLPDGGLIIAQDAEFLATIQSFGRFYRNWDVLQTDKLRIVDRGNQVNADINLDRTRMTGSVTLSRASQDSVPRTLELSTIDPAADYTIVPSKATRPHEPVNVTTSVATESVYLPMIMDTHTRQALVTYTLYREEVARKRVSATATIYGLEIEPGDLVALQHLGDDFNFEVFKCIETTHGVNYVVELTLESILRCSITDETVDPYWIYVVLLMGFEGADGSQGTPGFTDESLAAHGTATLSAVGTAQVDRAQFKFGLSSLMTTSDLIEFPDSPNWTLSSANSDEFTIECWVRFAAITNPSNGIVLHYFGPGNYSWGLETIGITGEFHFKLSSDGSTWNVDLTSSGAGLTTGVWYHLAVDKDSSGKIRLYKNGEVMASTTPANSSMHNASTTLQIGGAAFFGSKLNGWIDELRITKGVARYKTDRGFTAPTMAFARGAPL